MTFKNFRRRIEELQNKLHPKSCLPNLSLSELKRVVKEFLFESLKIEAARARGEKQAFDNYQRRIQSLMDEPPPDPAAYEAFAQWKILWELEKNFARQENRTISYVLNVLMMKNPDDHYFEKLRANLGFPPLSSEHKKAIRRVLSEFDKEDQESPSLED